MKTDLDFDALVRSHRREIRVHCYRMLGSISDAEDLTQETFARAWRSREGFEGKTSARRWLHRIATNACLDAMRGRVVSERVLVSTAEGAAWLEPYPDAVRMPPGPALHGRAHVRSFFGEAWPKYQSFEALPAPTRANGAPAIALYHAGKPHSLHVLDIENGTIVGIAVWIGALGRDLFPRFGLPLSRFERAH